jgi:hypothetical protein
MSAEGAIPYEVQLQEKNLTAGFFRVLRSKASSHSFIAGLLLIDARGEPLEFTYSNVEAGQRFLWRDSTLRSGAIRELAMAVFDVCPRTPTAIFVLAGEVDAEIFTEHLDVQRPLARVGREQEVIGVRSDEAHELVSSGEPVQLLWVRDQPSPDSEAGRLVASLARRNLLIEPFERVVAGLREVYADQVGELEADESDD